MTGGHVFVYRYLTNGSVSHKAPASIHIINYWCDSAGYCCSDLRYDYQPTSTLDKLVACYLITLKEDNIKVTVFALNKYEVNI